MQQLLWKQAKTDVNSLDINFLHNNDYSSAGHVRI